MALSSSRRRWLQLCGAAALAGVAGCSTVTDHEFAADPVYVRESDAETLGYRETARDEETIEYDESVAGVDVSATVTNHVAVYEETVDGAGDETVDEADDETTRSGAPSVLRSVLGDSGAVGLPASDLEFASGPLAFLESDESVDASRIALLVPNGALDGAYLGAGSRREASTGESAGVPLAMVHRGALGGTEARAAGDGELIPGDMFFPGDTLFPDGYFFPGDTFDEEERRVGGTELADLQVAFIPGDSFVPGDSWIPGDMFAAGDRLDADLLVAPADAAFGLDVKVTDPDGQVPIAELEARDLADAPIGAVLFGDDEGQVAPLSYIPGDSSIPGDTLIPGDSFTPERAAVEVPLDAMIPGDSFGKTALDRKLTAIFFPETGRRDLPEGARPVEAGESLDAESTAVFFPGDTLIPGDMFSRDGSFFPGDTLIPGDMFSRDDSFFPGDTLIPGDMFFPGDSFVRMRPTSYPAIESDVSRRFPGEVVFPGDTFTPSSVVHLPAVPTFPSDRIERVGHRAALSNAGSLAKVDPRANVVTAGGFSSPQASVMGRTMNPLGDYSATELLTDEQVRGLLGQAGLDGLDEEWIRDPTVLESTEIQFVGGDAAVETHAGVAGSRAEPTVAYLHVVLVEDAGDVVLAAAVSGWDVADPDRPFVGADGYLNESALDEGIEHATEILEAFRHG